MSKLNEISGNLLVIANLPPENRNSALLDLSVVIKALADYEMVQEQKDLIESIINDLIAENDAEQIAKSKLVFVEDVEEQIAPTKKTKVEKVLAPVIESTLEDLPDKIDRFLEIIDLPKPVTPKAVKIVLPKVVKTKVIKPKVIKPKAEDDLSFLDDLNNIF